VDAMKKRETIVLKFGSSVLRDESDLHHAVSEIRRVLSCDKQVLVVASALGDTTNRLLKLAGEICTNHQNDSALAALLATGEAVSTALLGLALTNAGIPARVLNPFEAGLRTKGDRLNAEVIAVEVVKLRKELASAVVVIPGFVGLDNDGSISLLGRGGSDLTALFLAHELSACCVLLKDVDGLYTEDPSRDPEASPFEEVTYETALRIGGELVQEKAIHFAAARDFEFSVTAIGAVRETVVGRSADRIECCSQREERVA
jgi:homoserine dehydrogenase